MSDDKKIPIAAVVYVVRFSPQGEPEHVASVHIDQASQVSFTGDAGRAMEPLLRATYRATSRLMKETMEETMEERAAELRTLQTQL